MAHKRIEIFKIMLDFNSPIGGESDKIIQNVLGDYLVIINDEVYVENENDIFTKVVYSAEFVRLNKKIFEVQ
jgi:hypothetical protein